MDSKNPTLADQHVGLRMRGRRQDLNLSQQELAERLGITFQQVQKYERGANRVSAGRLYEMAKAMETTIAYFYEGFEGIAASRRGVAEEGADFKRNIDPDVHELMLAFAQIEDAATRKAIIASVKKQAKTAKPAKKKPR